MGGNDPALGGDIGLISFAVGFPVDHADMQFLASGNIQIFNQVNSPASDTGNLLQVYGNLEIVDAALFNDAPQDPVAGSVSGTATFSQPDQGSSYKKAIVYCDALSGSAAYVFPTVFINPPSVTYADAGLTATWVSVAGFTANGTVTSGYIILEGF